MSALDLSCSNLLKDGKDSSMKASDLRGILTYIPSFRDKLFVLNVDSAVLEDERAASLFLDISVLRSFVS